jgi:hypothetical protein
MIEIYNEYDHHLQGGHFSSYKKNLGNKLFIYATCKIISDSLDYNLILPDKSFIRRETQKTNQYIVDEFPFGSITNKKSVDCCPIVIDDDTFISYGSIENFIKKIDNNKILSTGYYSKYEYIKPYKNEVRNFYKKLVKEKRNNNDIIMMLRNSRDDARFVIDDEYYLTILENEEFENLYVSIDHTYQHSSILKKIEKYNPKFIDGGIIDVFSEITSFNRIIACQGTFSFWACFLSNAEKIYWPLTKDGPNSNNLSHGKHLNLIVDDESRYEFIKLK